MAWDNGNCLIIKRAYFCLFPPFNPLGQAHHSEAQVGDGCHQHATVQQTDPRDLVSACSSSMAKWIITGLWNSFPCVGLHRHIPICGNRVKYEALKKKLLCKESYHFGLLQWHCPCLKLTGPSSGILPEWEKMLPFSAIYFRFKIILPLYCPPKFSPKWFYFSKNKIHSKKQTKKKRNKTKQKPILTAGEPSKNASQAVKEDTEGFHQWQHNENECAASRAPSNLSNGPRQGGCGLVRRNFGKLQNKVEAKESSTLEEGELWWGRWCPGWGIRLFSKGLGAWLSEGAELECGSQPPCLTPPTSSDSTQAQTCLI